MGREEDLDALIGRIQPARTTIPNLQCCCGSIDCQYLKHSSKALDSLENDVQTAAQLGQALLVRHEQFMQDAERDRIDLGEQIEKLESDKKELENQNAKTIEQNRDLLDQLEDLNGTVLESETHIKSLEATLQSTHHELRRLEMLASRTSDLEIQVAALEQEQDVLQRTVATSEADERSAVQRWKTAERRLFNLQEQLEKIERETKEERERHVEVLGRMERQRVVERELDTAAGRLKGAAAATTSKSNHGSNVVSHFVKDILQDNANLQLGIVELREMLINSNDEVQTLREQLVLHQPVIDANDILDGGPPTLRADLAPEEMEEVQEPPVVSQALHIHHHYHTPKKDESRRPKKKRTSLNTTLFTPPHAFRASRPPAGQETLSAILSQTSVTIPTPITPNKRWSVQSGHMSDFAPSSVPSSPQSMYRNSTLFDRGFDLDSSRPTSPGSSVDPMSPQFAPQRHRKCLSDVSTRSFIAPSNFQPANVIQEEEDGDIGEISSLQTPSINNLTSSNASRDTPCAQHRERRELEEEEEDEENWLSTLNTYQPSLRRTTSHESILSISGIDIHTLKARPSQITITGGNALLRPRSRLGTSSTMASVETVIARPTLTQYGHNSTAYLRSSIGAHVNTSVINDTQSISSSGSGDGIGKKVGGWVFGRWGISPAKSSGNLKAAAATKQPPQRVVSAPATDPLRTFRGRTPGINQKGPIPGFIRNIEKAPSQVKPDLVDHDSLREILSDGKGS